MAAAPFGFGSAELFLNSVACVLQPLLPKSRGSSRPALKNAHGQKCTVLGPPVAVVDDIVGGHGLLAAGPGFEKLVQFAFYQLERFFAAQHQIFHPVPTQVESVGVAEEVTKLQVVVQVLNQLLG